ncbi:MAG: MarR family winged helix-turn-helix transcriptional regulator [Pseudomonadota bacterium]
MSETKSTVPSLFLREEELRRGVELMFFAGQVLAHAADPALENMRLGRAHQRALHFIHRRPGLTVGELLGVLRITKQSLNRVMQRLIAEALVAQRASAEDRRRRELRATDKGAALARRLESAQLACIAAAYRAAGPHAVGGFWEVLEHIKNADRSED